MVLKVTHLKSSGAAVGKYLRHGLDQSEADDDAAEYFAAHGAATQWVGELAAEFGLTGAVDPEVLSAALDGTLPSGENLPAHPSRRIGEDLTFSAPKSLSIAALTWGDDRLVNIHDAAVNDALVWVQENMIYARRGKCGLIQEHAPKVMIGCHRHIDARPVTLPNGEIFIAPQVHTHCVIPNLCRRKDGSLGGIKIDFGESSGLRLYADAIYQSSLASRLRKLGIALRETKDGFELLDVDDQMIADWSPRKAQIDQQLAAQGLSRETSTESQRQAANLKTREAKSTNMTPAQLRKEWAVKAAATKPSAYSQPGQNVTPVTVSVQNTIDDMAERLAVIPTPLLYAKATLAGCANHTAQEIGQVLQRNEALINLNSGQHVTTIRAVADESYIKAIYEQSRNMLPALIDPDAVHSWLDWCEQHQGFQFSTDQQRALVFLSTNENKISLAVGAAGAGKTTIMSAISNLASMNYEVVGLAPSHNSAQALREATGQAQTLASWITNPPKSGGRARFIILDEAGMTSTHDMSALLRTLQPADRLLLIGDPRQLGPISAGQPFADLLKQNQHATLNQIRRQEDEEQRIMVSSFASGNVRAGAQQLMKFVNETADFNDTLEQAANAYLNAQGSVVALASRRQTANDLSLKIRQKMQESGRLAPDMCAIQSVEKVPLTRAALRRKPTYTKGTRIKNTSGKIFRVEAPAFILNNQAVVTVTDGEKQQIFKLDDIADDGWGIVTLQDMNITMGEQLLVTDTTSSLTLNGEIKKLRNGQTLTIQNVTENGKILATLPTGEQLQLDATSPLSVSYGWAKTIHKSQGQTVDFTIVIDDGIAGGQLAYVAASRQKQSLRIFSHDPDDLESRISVWAIRASALDYKPSTLKDQKRHENALKYALLEAQQTQHTEASQQPEQHHFQGMRQHYI